MFELVLILGLCLACVSIAGLTGMRSGQRGDRPVASSLGFAERVSSDMLAQTPMSVARSSLCDPDPSQSEETVARTVKKTLPRRVKRRTTGKTPRAGGGRADIGQEAGVAASLSAYVKRQTSTAEAGDGRADPLLSTI